MSNYLGNENPGKQCNYHQHEYSDCLSLLSLGEFVFHLGIPPSGTLWWVRSIVNETKKKKKQAKRPRYESDSDQEEPYLKLIVLQLKEPHLTKLSPFIMEKTISSIIPSFQSKT